jgi:hypothetical protein
MVGDKQAAIVNLVEIYFRLLDAPLLEGESSYFPKIG